MSMRIPIRIPIRIPLPIQIRSSPSLRPLVAGDHRDLQGALAVEVEVADVERQRGLDPLVDRLAEQLEEARAPGGERGRRVLRKQAGERDWQLGGRQLLAGVPGEAGVEDGEGDEVLLALLVLGELGAGG